jgi:hypothetical protein
MKNDYERWTWLLEQNPSRESPKSFKEIYEDLRIILENKISVENIK